MRNASFRWPLVTAGVPLRRLGLAAVCALMVASASVSGAEARQVALRGAEMNRFGRVALEFDKPTKVSARAANGVLVISFGEASTIKTERLTVEMPAYVSTVRHDPDGTGIRLALTQNYKVNVLEAGERVFVDLIPETWTGLLPSLPPDVVAELARRAEAAEARARAEAARRQAEVAKPVRARVASLPTLTRVVFEPPGIAPVRYSTRGNEITLVFEGAFTLDRSQIAGQLAPAVRSMSVDERPEELTVRMVLDGGYEARGFREDEAFVLDLGKPQSAAVPQVPPAPTILTPKAPESKADIKSAKVDTKPAPPEPTAAPVRIPRPPEPPPVQVSGPVQPAAAVTQDGLRVTFPFAGRVAAAAFERAGILTLAFHTPDPIVFSGLPAEAEPFARLRDVTRDGAFALVRFTLPKTQMVRLAPQERGWVLTVGGGHGQPSEPLPVNRKVDDAGRTVMALPLADASGVHWIEDAQAGERVAVVTSFGAPRGTPKAHRFVEFTLLPTIHGVAVAAVADDLVVRSGIDGVTISRGSGLSVSLPGVEREGEPVPVARIEPVIQRDAWTEAQLGSVQDRIRDLLRAAAEAPRLRRGPARLAVAQAYLANDMSHEAASVLAFAGQEDPQLQAERPFLLLQGVAALRSGHLADARRILGAGLLAEDPEGILWRASLDAQQKRWPQALTGFRRAAAALDSYPESLQGPLRLQAARAAIEMRDFVYADRELSTAGPMLSPPGRDEAQLLRARLDEALGRPEVALDTYRLLAQEAERPVAAQATLHLVDLGLVQGGLKRPEAIPLLETLSVVWRGGDVEVAALGRLGRLYAETGRWREAFTVARRANQMFADHEVTRALHDDTARLFEDLFLSGKGDTLSRVDSLALYFDFKEFTPIGRRGDEIVRRLSDRLVELDLLDQAGALLQHQVDQRLFGAARATVAARLATVRLMDGKPALALQALRSTRLPELPLSVNRARLLLEARALSDLSRTDLALEVLQGETGPEIDRLRADVLWSGRRWREAGEAHETIVGTRWQGTGALGDRERTDVLRAAIAYSLADDVLSLDRVRSKFASKMADSADARTFAFLTQPNVASTRAFRDLARRVTSADTLADFLSEYRKRYPDAAAAERPRTPPAPASPEPQTPAAPGSTAQAPATPAPRS
ncbi:MAG TPA: hypothetical protein VIL09_13185 [Microvirga sp.]